MLGLTFIAAALALYFAHVVDKEKSGQLRQFDKELTDAKTELGKQQVRAADAETALKVIENTLSAANEKAANLELAVESQRERAANAERQLEAERIERAKMEAAISPRMIAGQNEIGGKLKQQFPGMKVKMYSPGDSESWRLAGQIGCVADVAGWSVISMGKFVNSDAQVLLNVGGKVMAIPIPFREGVEIGVPRNHEIPTRDTIAKQEAATKAAEAPGRRIRTQPYKSARWRSD